MKKLLLFFSLLMAVLLCGCVQAQSGISSSSSTLAQSKAPDNVQSYLCDSQGDINANSFKWLYSGDVLALPYKNKVQYIDKNNRLLHTAQLAQDAGENFALYDNRIFVMGTKKTENSENKMQIRFENGEYTFANCSLYDSKGKLIKEFPVFEALQEETPLQFPQSASNAFWVNDDTLIVQVKNAYLLSYKVSESKVSVIENQSLLIDTVIKEKGNQAAAYTGIQYVGTNGRGFYYFLHDNSKLLNSAGKIYYAEGDTKKELFSGQEFSKFYVDGSKLLIFDELAEGDSKIYYADEKDYILNQLSLDKAKNWYCSFISDNVFGISDGASQFFGFNTDTGDLTGFKPDIQNAQQYELLNAVSKGEATQFIYSAMVNGAIKCFSYDTAADKSTPINILPLQGRYGAFSQNGTSYVKAITNNETVQNADKACVAEVS